MSTPFPIRRGPVEAEVMSKTDPTSKHRVGGYPHQRQEQPGRTALMNPVPDHGEDSYVGHGRLAGRRALITGGDSGIGRAVAIAFAREGADVAIAHLPEERGDALTTIDLVEAADRRGFAFAGDLREERFAHDLVEASAVSLGSLDIVVLGAAYQRDHTGLAQLPTDELERTFRTNLFGTMFVARAAIPHLRPGASIIVTTSIQAYDPSPELIDYAMTKAALVAFTSALAKELGPRGVRVNAIAPGPVWTPLIPATGWDDEKLEHFGENTPLGRAAQPAELAGAYVYLASEEASYVSGGVLPVTGGRAL